MRRRHASLGGLPNDDEDGGIRVTYDGFLDGTPSPREALSTALHMQAVQHTSQSKQTGSSIARTGRSIDAPAPRQPSDVRLLEESPAAREPALHTGTGDATRSRMPTAAELHAELLAARELTSTRSKGRMRGTAAKHQQRQLTTAADVLLSNKKPRFRIMNSPAADAEAVRAAAEQKRRLLMGSAHRGCFDQPDPATPMSRQPAAPDEDGIVDADDYDELPLLAQERPETRAVQTLDLDMDTIEGMETPRPEDQQPVADARQTAAYSERAAQMTSHRTPATGQGTAHGAVSRHALLARLATTPRPSTARFSSQQRPLVKGSGFYAHLQQVLHRTDEQRGPVSDGSEHLQAEVLDMAMESHCLKLRCSCTQPGPALAFVLISIKALRDAEVAAGSRLLLRNWLQVAVNDVTLPVFLVRDAEGLVEESLERTMF